MVFIGSPSRLNKARCKVATLTTGNTWPGPGEFGRSYRLALVADPDVDFRLKEGRFCLKRSLIEQGGRDAARRAYELFY